MQTGSTPVLHLRSFCLQHHSLIDHLQRDIDGMNLIYHQSHLQRNHARADGNLQHSTPSPRSPEIFIEERRVHLPVILYNGIIVLGSVFTPEFSFVSDTDVILHCFSISHAFLPMSRFIGPIGISSVRERNRLEPGTKHRISL